MYGEPAQEPMRGMVTAVRADGRADIEIGCDGMSSVSGMARAVPHRDTVPLRIAEQCACWWAIEQEATAGDTK
jgi:hypothetical protein